MRVSGPDFGDQRTFLQPDSTMAKIRYLFHEAHPCGYSAKTQNDFNTLYVGTEKSLSGRNFRAWVFSKLPMMENTWTLLPPLRMQILIPSMKFMYPKTVTVYPSTLNGGLLRSTGGGQVWEKVWAQAYQELTAITFMI